MQEIHLTMSFQSYCGYIGPIKRISNNSCSNKKARIIGIVMNFPSLGAFLDYLTSRMGSN
jgi:hypothetical protein